MFPGLPSASDILNGSRTTSGTLITIPAGKWFTGNIQINAAVAALATSSPTVTVSGTGAAPASGSVVARVDASGLVAGAAAASGSSEVIILAPSGNSVDLVFNASSGTTSAIVNGYVF